MTFFLSQVLEVRYFLCLDVYLRSTNIIVQNHDDRVALVCGSQEIFPYLYLDYRFVAIFAVRLVTL